MLGCSSLGWCSSATEGWHASGSCVALAGFKVCPWVALRPLANHGLALQGSGVAKMGLT